MSSYETLIYEKQGHVAQITLNRPHRLNALDDQLMHESGLAWREVKADPEVWAVVVTGAGRAFCAGGDVKQFDERKSTGQVVTGADGVFDPGHRGWGPRAYDVQKPIVVAVNGVCSGGGLDYVTEGDIVVAAEDAEFFDSHVSIGWVSSHEAIQLSRKLPLGEALMMVTMGNQYRLSARRAHELGLVQRVVPTEHVVAEAVDIAERICANSPGAVWGTKQGIWHGLDLPLDTAIEVGERFLLHQTTRHDHAEGPRAFVEKRPPEWKAPEDWVD